MSGELPTDLLSKLKPSTLLEYAQTRHWEVISDAFPGVALMKRGRREVLVPTAEGFADSLARLQEAIEAIAATDSRPVRHVLTEALMPASDILRYRLVGPSAQDGFVPLESAFTLFESCEQALKVAARTVLSPRSHYDRLRLPREPAQFLARCKFGTERGSFVAAIACPLTPPSSAQLTLPEVKLPQGFLRTVVETAVQSARNLAEAMRDGSVDDLVAAPPGETLLSANLCEALSSMVPDEGDLALEVSAAYSSWIPREGSMSESVPLDRQAMSAIRGVAARLQPTTVSPSRKRFSGLVDSLHGGPEEQDPEKATSGDIVIALPSEDRRIRKLRVTLDSKDYPKACDAHRDGYYVSLNGVLDSVQRRIVKPKDFRREAKASI